MIIVVILLLIVTSLKSTMADDAFQPLDEPYEDPEESEDRKVSECFGKVRVSCDLNPEFSSAIDRFTRTMRVDKLREMIEWKVGAICNEQEKEVTISLLCDELSHSATIVKETVHNLTDYDRDRLNMWSNLNDTISERNFYVEKIKSLSPADTEILTNSLNSLISRLVNGDPPECINEVIGLITPEEKRALSSPDPAIFEKAINQLLNKSGTSSESGDLRLFLSGTWRPFHGIFT
ncbi:hypothetical protein PMAYCL1PPCAC_12949, partial [Pristionchus mayeri]